VRVERKRQKNSRAEIDLAPQTPNLNAAPSPYPLPRIRGRGFAERGMAEMSAKFREGGREIYTTSD
jgi:hypothetical protein